jgi:DNA-binding MarR family transcriptional regulator
VKSNKRRLSGSEGAGGAADAAVTGAAPPPEPAPGSGLQISWAEVGNFAEAVSAARTALLAAAKEVREEYSLGLRGPWIIGLISSGRIRTQSDLVRRYQVGRSIIAEEVAPLTAAGLVSTRPSPSDRRQLELSLTPRGFKVNEQLGESLIRVVKGRLSGYSRYDLLFCMRLLNDLSDRSGEVDNVTSR